MNKKIKILTKIFFIFLMVFILCTPRVEAAKRAIFPDSKSLQPIPAGVHANISGNINSKVNDAIPAQNVNTFSTDTQNSVRNIPNTASSEDGSIWFSIISTIVALLVILFLYFSGRKKRQKEKM